MAIAARLKWYLDSRNLDYELVHHDPTSTSLESAITSRVPGGKVAKCVLLEDERGYLLAVVPASCRVLLKEVERQLHRRMSLASELELAQLFEDCRPGAVPPAGPAYGIPTLVDDSLLRLPDLYFEAGDHEDLVHLTGDHFRQLLEGAQHASFSRPH